MCSISFIKVLVKRKIYGKVLYIAEFVATHTLAGTVPKERQTENKDQAASDKWNCHFFKMTGMGMAKKGRNEGSYTPKTHKAT